jgi:hypothetical protein
LAFLSARATTKAAVQIALEGNNHPLAVSTYATLPPEQRALMPSEEDLSRLVQDVIDADGRDD